MECRGLGPCHPHCLTKSLTQQGAERTLHHKCPPLEPTKPPCPPSQRASPHLGGHPPISEGVPPHLRGCPPISEGIPSSQRASPHLRGHSPISEGIPSSQRASPSSRRASPHLGGRPPILEGVPSRRASPYLGGHPPSSRRASPLISEDMVKKRLTAPPTHLAHTNTNALYLPIPSSGNQARFLQTQSPAQVLNR